MNTRSDAMPEVLPQPGAGPGAFSPARLVFWSVKRELWEYRSLYIAPLAIAAVFLFGFLISMVFLPGKARSLATFGPERFRQGMAVPYDTAAALMMATIIIVSVFYCLDALHGERRDRSILFWKSLPVSDLTTVLSKASIPLLILPLLAFVITLALFWIMLLLSSAVFLGSGLPVAELWKQFPPVEMSLLLLYHLLTAHALWPLPVYCWLLLVSGWARRLTFLWAALPVLAIAAFEQITFHSSHFLRLVGSRLIGAAPAAAAGQPDMFPTNPMIHIAPLQFLSSPGLWIGLLISAVFLAAAVRLRRHQGPI